MTRVAVLAGTQKGAFICWSDAERREWRIDGPMHRGWEVTTLDVDDRDGKPTLWAGVGSEWFGASLHRSDDLGESWSQIESGPAYPADAGRRLERIWTVRPGHPSEPDVLWAGVAQAGLFRSADRGETWSEVPGLNDHPTRSAWSPGAGGLCCHTLLVDPSNPRRLWAGISAVGCFRTDDGGETWSVHNQGIPRAIEDEEHKEVGCCVHKMVLTPNRPDRLFQQNHKGVFRSVDGADSWQRIENGLSTWFGFPMVMDPNEPDTLFVVPQESDEYRFPVGGRLTVGRTCDGGESWELLRNGLPSGPTYTGVLRSAMAVDGLPACGVYFGTSGGQIHYSRDRGDSWHTLPCVLPRISSVTTMVLD